jgi:hypothetical protein
MNHHWLEPLAYLVIIGIDLVLIGAILTAGPVTIEQRAAALTGIFASLGIIAYRGSKYRKPPDQRE